MKRDAIDELLALATGQDSLVTVQQAASLNITPPMLRVALDRGWIHRQRRGVFVAGGAGPSRWRPVVAAALAAGPNAVVSHTTAAELHAFHGVLARGIELTIPATERRNLHGVTIHQSTTLLPEDVGERNGLRLTSPVRTLIEVAGRFHDPLLGKIIDEGAIARLWTPEAVGARLDGAGRGVAGVAELRRLLDLRLGEGKPDSHLEQRVIRVVKRVAEGYTLHHREVFDGEVIEMDIAWVAERIDGEVDGMRTRVMSRTKFERERRRANILAAHGWRIVHFTDKMNDEMLIAQLAPLLGL
jgi:hypothetical protein